jgi:hypothetical protein
MNVDIDKLSETELIDLNHRIVARLRFLNHWTVAPGLLRKGTPTESTETNSAKVIQLRKE